MVVVVGGGGGGPGDRGPWQAVVSWCLLAGQQDACVWPEHSLTMIKGLLGHLPAVLALRLDLLMRWQREGNITGSSAEKEKKKGPGPLDWPLSLVQRWVISVRWKWNGRGCSGTRV